MTTKDFLEGVIKAHVKDRKELYNNVRGLKVLNVSTLTNVTTTFKKADGKCAVVTRYLVECSIKAKKYENNILCFQVLIYDNPDFEIEVFYDSETYRSDC